MQFDYRYTNSELRHSLRLNGALVRPRWKMYLLIVVCLLPSLFLFLSMDAVWSAIWFGVMTLVMVGYLLVAFIKGQDTPKPYDQTLRLSETDFRNQFSQSISQVKWGLVEEIEETSDSFQLKRLSRCWMIPKRVLADQLTECRSLFEQVQQQPLSEEAIELYEEVFEVDSPFEIFHFQYQPDDLELALQSPFQQVDSESRKPLTPSPNSSRRGHWVAWIFLVAAVALLIVMGTQQIETDKRSPSHLSMLVCGWVLPVVLVLGYAKISALLLRRAARVRVPPDPCELRLSEKGWAVGDRHGVVLFDWRDVSGIYENRDFYGFKSVNHLLNLIPQRAFADQAIANRFLATAMDLKRRASFRDDIVTPTVVESGNPYQSPMR